MSYITNKEDIIAKANIVSVVSKRIALNSQNKACCPFHEEKTPSFTVTPEKNMYYCHGACKTGGNAISFIMAFDGVEFPQALETLAVETGVIPIYDQNYTPDPNRIDRKDIYNALALATIHFQENLLEETKYLYDRGFTDSMIKKYQLGYAKGNAVAKVAEERFLIAGDILRRPQETSKSKTPYNPFRGRIIIPLHDLQGKVVGFTGREIQGKENTAKYLNSHETDLYKKGSLLYGYHFANNIIRPDKSKGLYILEGQLKTIANLEAGFPTVSAGGTSFSDRQAELIEMLTKKERPIYICQDYDQAGIVSTIKILSALRSRGLIPKVGVLNKDSLTNLDITQEAKNSIKDTDDLLKHNLPIQWTHLHYIDWILHVYQYKTNDAESAKMVKEVILPIINASPDSIIRNADTNYLHEKTDIPKDILGTQNLSSAIEPQSSTNRSGAELVKIDEKLTSKNLLFAFMLQYKANEPHLITPSIYTNLNWWWFKPDVINQFKFILQLIERANYQKLPMSQIIAEYANNNPQLNYWLNITLPKIDLEELTQRIIKGDK